MSNNQHIFKIKAEHDGSRLDAALSEMWPGYGLRARRRLWEWCEVSVDGTPRKPSYKVRAGQEVVVKPLDTARSAAGADCRNAPLGTESMGEAVQMKKTDGLDGPPGEIPTTDAANRNCAFVQERQHDGAGFDLNDFRQDDSNVPGVFAPGCQTPELLASAGELLGASGLDELRESAQPAETAAVRVDAGTARGVAESRAMLACMPGIISAGNEPDFSGFIPEIVAAGINFVAFSKPGGLPSVALSGGAGLSFEELVSRHWDDIWRNFAQRKPQEAEAVCEALAAGCSPGGVPARPVLCNRLDTATSGLLLGAFGAGALALFKEYEREGKARKKYLAMVHGIAPQYMLMDKTLDTYKRKTTLVLPHTDLDYTRHTRSVLLKIFETPEEVEAEGGERLAAQLARPDEDPVFDAFRTDARPDGEASEFARNYAEALDNDASVMAGLRYLVSLTGPLSLLELTILRGARHQIRAHLAGAGFPIVGDAQYGLESTSRAGRMYLHHFEISLPGFRAETVPDWRITLE